MGYPLLLFEIKDEQAVFIAVLNNGVTGMNTHINQEHAIRDYFEKNGRLTAETYSSTHAVAEFVMSTGETAKLLLSQPVKQTESGIWVVERWMDGNGSIYREPISLDNDSYMDDYWQALQQKVDNGDVQWRTDPLEVAYQFVAGNLGHHYKTKHDIALLYPASLEDFSQTPISQYIGYIMRFIPEDDFLEIDRVEIIYPDDSAKIEALALDIEKDMPNGYYVYNSHQYPQSFSLNAETSYYTLNRQSGQLEQQTAEVFMFQHQLRSDLPLYIIYTNNGYVTKVEAFN